MKKLLTTLLITFSTLSFAQNRIAYWSFDRTGGRLTEEAVTHRKDTIEGYFTTVKGVKGNAIGLDGMTTCIRKQMPPRFRFTRSGAGPEEFTIEAWIELGNYPWNWCPILTTEADEPKGYRFMVGPYGQLALEVGIGEQWETVSTDNKALPLRKWLHVAATYRADDEIAIYIDGKKAGSKKIQGSILYPQGSPFLIGMVAYESKPADMIGASGCVAQYHGLDGSIDEVQILDKAVTADRIAADFAQVNVPASNLPERKMPTVHNPRQFGAFYTTLKYYPGWDKVWPVAEDADIVVCFEKSPVKLMFWRGIRYGASWVDEKENWMTDQSVEAWRSPEGCFEHMQDRHCRFSHVRVIENNPARVVVHWRYAPVSSWDNTWRPDPKTGWEVWIDEYYYIYPDASAVRRVSWKKGSLGYPRQFQETLALLHPGQNVCDLVEPDYCHVADYNGKQDVQQYVANPTKPRRDHDYTIQQYNFKSANKPFILFEEGNNMNVRANSDIKSYTNEGGGCSHFPVGQARSHGTSAHTNDRARHVLGFPISYPPIHEDCDGDRHYWAGIYGMNGMDIDGLINYGRSWMYAPEMTVSSKKIENHGYDRSRRCYDVTNLNGKPVKADFTISGNEKSPVKNPALIIRNWNGPVPEILVNGKKSKEIRTGINRELDSQDLVVFLFHESHKPVTLNIRP